MRLGLISDTHGLFDERLPPLFVGVDAILHAGDVGSPAILDRLALIAPTRAVRGNVDSSAFELPPSLLFEAGSVRIEVRHIVPASTAQLHAWSEDRSSSRKPVASRDRLLTAFSPHTQAVIFGHSHQPGIYLVGGPLLINPGSAGPRRFSLPRSCAVMDVGRSGAEVKIFSLEDYNLLMRKSVRFGPGGFASCLR